MDRSEITELKERFPKGTGVRLIRCTDPYTPRPVGLLGVVNWVDALGTIHVNWENGSTLGVCLESGDAIEITCVPDTQQPV